MYPGCPCQRRAPYGHAEICCRCCGSPSSCEAGQSSVPDSESIATKRPACVGQTTTPSLYVGEQVKASRWGSMPIGCGTEHSTWLHTRLPMPEFKHDRWSC